MLRNALTRTGRWMLYLLAALVILIALLLASVRIAVFYSKDYSQNLASLVSSYLGSPVTIGEMDLVWNRFDASASLKDVRIQSAEGQSTLLELPTIDMQLNVKDMLLDRRLTVRSVQLSNLSLFAAYEGPGKLTMFGTQLDGSAFNPRLEGSIDVVDKPANADDLVKGDTQTAEDSEVAEKAVEETSATYSVLNWLFNAERIAILDSDITLLNKVHGRQYRVDNVNIRAFNDGDLHQIRVSNALPGGVGETSLGSFDFTGKADNINDWKGQFYLNAKGLNLEQLSEFRSDTKQKFRGITDLTFWGKWHGTRVNSVRGIVGARNVAFKESADSAQSIESAQVNIDLDWLRTDAGWELAFNQLNAVLEDEVRLDGLQLSFDRESNNVSSDAATGDNKRLYASGPQIDLAALAPLYPVIDTFLPDNAAFKTTAIKQGLVSDWSLAANIDDNAATLTEAVLQTSDVAIDAVDKFPGVRGLSVDINYQQGIGQAVFNNRDIQLTIPGLFESELPVVNANGLVSFAQQNNNWKMVSEDFELSSLDFNTSTTFSLNSTDDSELLLDLHTTVANANLNNISKYYPTRVMKPKLASWMQMAIVEGDVVRGRVELKGDLKNFAPAQGKGHFYAESDVVGATVKFRPDWPPVKEVDGNVSLTARSMRGRVYKGGIRAAQFNDARLHIADFKDPLLTLQTNAIGPLSDILDFAQTGPLAPKIGAFFGEATGSGTSRTAFDLEIPLRPGQPERLVVNGETVLDNAKISMNKYGIDLDSATGNIGFNRRGLVINDLKVRHGGLPLEVKATQKTNGAQTINRLSVDGPVALSTLMRSRGIPLVDQFEGESNWKLNIDITRDTPTSDPKVELNASSKLVGTEFKLPAPLTKAAGKEHSVAVYKNFSTGDKDWWIDLENSLKGRVRIAPGGKLESIALALGGSNSTVLPWRGVAIHGEVDQLEALEWFYLAQNIAGQGDPDGEEFPLFAKLDAKNLRIKDELLGKTLYIAYRDGKNQIHRVENPLVSGELIARYDRQPDEALVLRLDRLNKDFLTSFADNNETGMTATSYAPQDLPPLDVTVSELKWNNWRLERLAMRTQPTDAGLRIVALTARQQSMRLSGGGRWNYVGGLHSTSIDLNASFEDFGDTISSISGVRSFADGQGEAGLSLTWNGPAVSPDLTALTGSIVFHLREGRILTVEPGAGRILGLFALQALPRRLTLDFRDITKTGLEFNNMSGNLGISNGKATANAIAVTGPVAEILIRGDTDFVAATYDQTIDVLPRVSGALPLLGVLSGGAAAGVTALLADGLLRGIGVNLDELGRRRLSLTGSWDNPQWETVRNTVQP